ncbi:2-dehydro-3-deoxygalactonokinase [Citrobacter youngae]|uniref:2-dehydro-3-deoxygalactonokinase n=1 Tax=Citrobacter youngae TaxID=133448 RepID=A0A9Q7ZLJ7_9ENTR|nr:MULTISPECIES: 2-dehydro-3-deoxygalactonokinase [Citrobacter]MDM2732916.1 2-dehydro-3-deoxygalactonokinase [Citrobacter sp. Cy070]SUX79037.1 2-dehydro-3-deoxygalactonokinase [Citrobacter youngae]
MFNSENFIAVDWGSSNLRIWVYQQNQCVWQHADQNGVLKHNPDAFKDTWLTLLSLCPQPLSKDTTVIMSGMVGSNIGWVDSHYLRCPTPLSALSQHLTAVEDAGPFPTFIVPGLQIAGPKTYNVMRGEETQLFGTLTDDLWYVFPGTHSKWVQVQEGIVCDFQTIMTGEFFHLLSHYSIVGKNAGEQNTNIQAFLDGAERGWNETCLSRSVFDLRARILSHSLPPDTLYESLSGLLIGHEIAQMLQHYAINTGEEVVLVGNEDLLSRYQSLFHHFGYRCRLCNGEKAFINGIRRLLHE